MLAKTLLLALSFASAQAPDEAALAVGLVELRAHLSAGRWAPAQAQARLLIEQHQAQPYIWRNLPALRDALEWSAFSSSYRAPAPKDVVSGDLLFYSDSGGNARLRYSHTQLADFRDASDGAAEKVGGPLAHPASFAGAYTLEVRGAVYASEPSRVGSSDVVPCVDIEDADGRWTRVSFGLAPRVSADKRSKSGGAPAYVQGSGETGGSKQLALRPESPCVPRQPYRIRVAVTESSITATYNGKQFLTALRPVRSFGRVVLHGFAGLDEISIDGKLETAWMQDRLDAHAQKAWIEFSQALPESARLPERLILKPCGTVLDQPLRTRRDVLQALELQRAELAKYPDNDQAAALSALCLHVLSEYDELDRLLDQRAQMGRFTRELDEINSTLHRARHGPLWESPALVESTNFVVATDLDLRTAREVSALLESSVVRFQARLRPNLPPAAERARVFVFSGRLGYERYLAGALGRGPENTAGMYHPGLRQLLVWNAPKRADLLETVRHEGLHQFLDRWLDDPPVWLNEGLAEYYENAEFERGPASEIRPHREHLDYFALPIRVSIDLEVLLRGNRASFYRGAPLSYSCAWGFVHFLLGSTRKNRALFDALIEELASGASGEDAVKKVFADVDLKALEDELNAHIRKLAKPR